jgi:arsenate reductase
MIKILFICTHNRCRSILAEAITNHVSATSKNGWLNARSAGSQPAGQVHPLSIKYLQERNISTDDLMSQSWDEFQDWAPDVVITVCDSAANEQCPVWFGDTLKIHWGLKDPSKLANDTSDETIVAAAFQQTINTLEKRITQLINIPETQRNGEALRQSLLQLESINEPF